MALKSLSSSERLEIGLFFGARFIDIASISAGVYHGYCDAQGIPLQKENLEFALTYGPAIVQGGIGTIGVGLVGLIGGRDLGTNSTLEKITMATGGTILGTAIGGANRVIKGGIQTLVGYGVGYLMGYIVK